MGRDKYLIKKTDQEVYIDESDGIYNPDEKKIEKHEDSDIKVS